MKNKKTEFQHSMLELSFFEQCDDEANKIKKE